uniref:Uncharacterized protein n=1 Tax=Aegilops tauschii subsp. strangulata TaxID=200361 RepID=A0A453D4I0_AEGTS
SSIVREDYLPSVPPPPPPSEANRRHYHHHATALTPAPRRPCAAAAHRSIEQARPRRSALPLARVSDRPAMSRDGGCCPPMDLLRSEAMQLVQVIIPAESARLAVSNLGDLGLLQFKDVRIRAHAHT